MLSLVSRPASIIKKSYFEIIFGGQLSQHYHRDGARAPPRARGRVNYFNIYDEPSYKKHEVV